MSSTGRPRSLLWRCCVAAVFAGMVLSTLTSDDSTLGAVVYLVPVVLCCLMQLVSVRSVRGPERRAWLTMAAGSLCFLVGEFVSLGYTLTGSESYPTPSDGLYIVALLVVAFAIQQVNRLRTRVTYRGDVLDSSIVAVSAGVVSVVFFVLPVTADTESSVLARVVSSSYPILDVVLIYLVARILITRPGRTRAHWLLLVAQLSTLAADVGWNVTQLTIGGDDYSHWMNALWQGWYLFTALATRSAAREPAPAWAPEPNRGLGPGRLTVLTVASLMPASILVLLDLIGAPQHTAWLAVGSIALGALVSARMWDLLQQLRAQTERVAQLATVDALTGLPNRRGWDQQLELACGATRPGDPPQLVALIDLDHFKAYNDRHGHQGGDALLRAAAEVWRSHLGDRGVLARWGGEEFVVLLSDHRTQRALNLLERFRALPDGQTCSIGVAVRSVGESPERLLRRADEALYAAKRGGRDRLVVAGDPLPGPGAAAAPVRVTPVH